MWLIKYFVVAATIISIIALTFFDMSIEVFMHNMSLILTLIAVLFFLSVLAKIAWKILAIMVACILIVVILNYFGIFEVSIKGFTEFFKALFRSEERRVGIECRL